MSTVAPARPIDSHSGNGWLKSAARHLTYAAPAVAIVTVAMPFQVESICHDQQPDEPNIINNWYNGESVVRDSSPNMVVPALKSALIEISADIDAALRVAHLSSTKFVTLLQDMDAREAFAHANANPPPSFGLFYGAIADAAVGAGMVLTDVEYPVFLKDSDRFGVVQGLALVLTHECDLDVSNDRLFNDSAIICPILPLENVAASVGAAMGDHDGLKWIESVTARFVNRVMYLPIIPDFLPLGGYLYFNLLTSTSRSKIISADKQVCMLSSQGLREVDFALERHFRRPKADRLPYQVELMFGRD